MCEECGEQHTDGVNCSRVIDHDRRIGESARARLRDCGQFHHGDIHLEVHAGEIMVHGRVTGWHQKQRAQEALRGIAGVVAIQNRIKVGPFRAATTIVADKPQFASVAT